MNKTLNGLKQNISVRVKENVELAPFTSFRVGGPAKYFFEPQNVVEFVTALDYVVKNEINYFVLGLGNNTVFSDKGFEGLVIRNAFGEIKPKNSGLTMQSGVSLPAAMFFAEKQGLTGLEFAAGIPGTIGGSIYGNAGSWGLDFAQIVSNVVYYDLKKAAINQVDRKKIEFGYRTSEFKENPWVILQCELKLKKGERKKIHDQSLDYVKQKMARQPKGFSAGCFFKNVEAKTLNKKQKEKVFKLLGPLEHPEKIPAGALIDKLGMKGKKMGGIMVANEHANFIVNHGQGNATQIAKLVTEIQEKVMKEVGIWLEPEVQIFKPDGSKAVKYAQN